MSKYGKRNEVQLNPLNYNIGVIGESGIGKTTLIKEVCEKLAGKDGYMFLETGHEDGAGAINDIVYEDCPDWETFEDITDDILDNKSTDYPNLKVVVIDTLDQLFDIAEPEVIRLHNNENPDKRTTTIKAAFGGFQAGEDKAIDLVIERLWSLKRVGVSFIVIGHTKKKDIEDVVTGQTYSTLTTNMANRYFNAIKNKLHFLGVASINREIVKEKTGKKNIVTKKDEEKGRIVSESRIVTFRDDNYTIDSKTRFADIVDSIPLDPDEFIKALQDAILKEHNKGTKTFEESQKEQEKAEANMLKNVADKNVKDKETKELKILTDKITAFIKENKSNMPTIKPVLEKAKGLGFTNPTLVDNLKDAKAIVALIG